MSAAPGDRDTPRVDASDALPAAGEFALRCADGLPLRVVRHLPREASDAALPLVVVCHGFKGFADWGMFPHLAQALADDGREVLRFDYSHNGVGEQLTEFTRLDLFERQTLSRHAADLRLVIDELGGDRPVWLVGHSMGGGIALMQAAADPRVAGVALLNAISHTQRVPPEARAELEATGRVSIPNARTGQVMPLGRAWFDDADALVLEQVARAVAQPALVLQGAADATVTPNEGEALASWLPRAELVRVPDGDHTFGAKHPWLGWTAPLERALAELQRFLPAAVRA